MPKPLIVRVVLQRIGVVGRSFLILVKPDAAQAAQFVAVGDIGIALNGFRTVGLGPGEVVEVLLGHAPEEPRLIEIGLGRDDLIEVLDGEDVVLEIECRPADGNQAVGIELGM